MRKDPEAQMARERGEKIYFTGAPCFRGHTTARRTCNGGCVGCQAEQHKARLDKRRQHDQEWRASNPEASFERNRKWRTANKGAKNALVTARKAAVARRTPAWSNLDAVKLVYLVCEQRTRLTGIAHHVDHFYPLNGKSISGLHVPLNLRVIPATENLRKGARLLGA
jgi:hypothetical protein